MTIGAWVLVIILGIIGIGIAIFCFLDDSKTGGLIAILITIIVVGGLILGLSWFYNNTGSGLRAMKDQQSNLNNGINRDIKVIESDGSVSYEFSGTTIILYLKVMESAPLFTRVIPARL